MTYGLSSKFTHLKSSIQFSEKELCLLAIQNLNIKIGESGGSLLSMSARMVRCNWLNFNLVNEPPALRLRSQFSLHALYFIFTHSRFWSTRTTICPQQPTRTMKPKLRKKPSRLIYQTRTKLWFIHLFHSIATLKYVPFQVIINISASNPLL